MKHIFKKFLIAAGLCLMAVSCKKEELDIASTFPLPSEITLNSLVSSDAYVDDAGRRIFDLVFTDGNTQMAVSLVGNKYFLTANQYTEAMQAIAQSGNFILGKTSIDGKQVVQGTINVALDESVETDEGCTNSYTIKSVLFAENGAPYKASWTGKISFTKDAVLAPELFYTDTVAQDCTLEDGQTPVTDVESHTLVVNNANGDFVAQFKFIRSLGTTDLSGEYTVKEYAHEDLTAGNGFDMSAFGWPVVIGTYYVDGGANVIVNAGETISVTAVEKGVYQIDGSTGYSFLIAPVGYVPGGVTVCDITDTVAQDCTLEDGQTPVTDVESHTLVLKDGDTFVAQVKLIRSVGTTDLSGEYTVKEYAHEDLTAGNGFDMSAFGWDVVIGTYYIGEDGSKVIVNAGETITVSKDGDIYTFEGSTDWVFKGKLTVPDDPGPGPGPGPGTEDEVTLTDFLSFTSYKQYNINLAGAELATSGFSYTADFDWTTFTTTYTFSGDGSFIKLELYTEGDTFAAGTYTPSADPNNVAAGEFKTGSAAGGTTWNVVKNNEITSTYVTDGTVNVSVDGDVYTIEVNSTAVNAKYVGKLSK